MNTKFIRLYVIGTLAFLYALSSCTDIEDYPDGRISYKDIFSSERRTGGYLNTCYSSIQNTGMWYGDNTFLAAFSDDAQDANDVNNGVAKTWHQGVLTPYNNPVETGSNGNWWANYYVGIRHCNIFLANIGNATIYAESTREGWRAQAYTLRAFYYLNLIKRYGGVPLVTEEFPLDYDYSKVQRSSFSACAKQIISDCNNALLASDIAFGWRSGSTDKERGKMHKGLAWAIKSQAALYAASPLWSDGTITWEDAATITKDAMQACENNGYALYRNNPGGTAGHTAYDVYFYNQSDISGVADKETIFESKERMEVYKYHGLPIVLGVERAGISPSQELVDCYETVDGVQPILGYKDNNHLEPIINPLATLYDELDPYANRDPRLKSTIYYNGAPYRLNDTNSKVETYAGGNCAVSASDPRFTRTGYYLRKYGRWESDRTNNQDGYFKQFRLAELYLNYAEAAAEAIIGQVPDAAVDAVNKIRDRVGMPALPYGMNKEDFIKRVRNERRVELAIEDHRFFDIRRWKILSEADRIVTGMMPVKNDNNTYTYRRFVVDGDRKARSDKFLMFPIPGDEAIRMLNFTGKDCQNPGWSAN